MHQRLSISTGIELAIPAASYIQGVSLRPDCQPLQAARHPDWQSHGCRVLSASQVMRTLLQLEEAPAKGLRAATVGA